MNVYGTISLAPLITAEPVLLMEFLEGWDEGHGYRSIFVEVHLCVMFPKLLCHLLSFTFHMLCVCESGWEGVCRWVGVCV